MNLQAFIISSSAAFPKAMSAESVADAAAELGLSHSQFCDLYAKEVANGFLAGKYTWSEGDGAMNALWGYISHSLMKDMPIPDYAFGVFLAFDAGETVHDSAKRTTDFLRTLNEKT